MSAYLCQDELFMALACLGAGKKHGDFKINPAYFSPSQLEKSHIKPKQIVLHGEKFDPERQIAIANFYAEVLKYENHLSLNSRYGDSLENIVLFEKPLRRIPPLKLSPAQLFKMCSCLEYQSCEHEEYYDSFAYILLKRVRNTIPSLLPDYENAEWGCPSFAKKYYTGDYQNHPEEDGISIFMLAKRTQAKEAKQ